MPVKIGLILLYHPHIEIKSGLTLGAIVCTPSIARVLLTSWSFHARCLFNDAIAFPQQRHMQHQAQPTPCQEGCAIRYSDNSDVGWSSCVVPSDQVPGVGLMGPPVARSKAAEGVGCVMKYAVQNRLLLLKRQGLNQVQGSRRISVMEMV
ncbi:hypothetical protein H257_14478 [Aphanomyces astaci]|uniref:Uncharacterized protein n=1 Tax=Aphanomyces astaci TaxID=112090 RepID=W4FSP0_APHAT|nr:hypothetical protein H257_14478 [Aphanomyces astaci]ETV69864.1 hypothetical protein H257_14478 [Aphanomyces astaci]|eukprot:XP_009840602.1 hypothetical protein H257_14478 [Aphanomyces astaci]